MTDIDRRDFLKWSTVVASGAACPTLLTAMELKLGGKNFHQIRTFHPRERQPYLCTMCSYFDGGFTYADSEAILKTEGNPDHIATRGKFCSKGLASFLGAADPDRILTPLMRVGPRGSGQWREIGWDEAIALVASKVQDALGDADSIYLNEGGFKDGGSVRFMDTLGSHSVIRSRLPSISSATKQFTLEQALGVSFVLPDLEHTKYVLNFGANIMETALPLAQRLTDGSWSPSKYACPIPPAGATSGSPSSPAVTASSPWRWLMLLCIRAWQIQISSIDGFNILATRISLATTPASNWLKIWKNSHLKWLKKPVECQPGPSSGLPASLPRQDRQLYSVTMVSGGTRTGSMGRWHACSLR